jgi:hypothetical protein
MASPQPPSPAAAIIAQWAASTSRTKQTAALLAAELAHARPGTPLESCAATADRLGITVSMAANARHHLTALRLIARHGGRYYPATTGKTPPAEPRPKPQPDSAALSQWETSGYRVLHAAAAITRHLHNQQPGTPVTTRPLAAALGLPHSTTDRAKRFLATQGILTKSPTNRYRTT